MTTMRKLLRINNKITTESFSNNGDEDDDDDGRGIGRVWLDFFVKIIVKNA